MPRRLAFRFRAVSVAAFLLLSGLESTAPFVVQTAQAASVSGPTATLSASPMSIAPGASTTLTWSSTNATSCDGYGGFSTNGGTTSGSVSVSPITTTTYGLSCLGTSGVASTTATVTVSLTNVVNANGNCSGSHAGTAGDPFPFQCIINAINGLPAGGGTVMVGDGVWATGTTYIITRGNWNLIGNSLNAKIAFVEDDFVWVNGNDLSIGNIRISNLTLDGSQSNLGPAALRLSALTSFSLSGNAVIGGQNGSVCLILIEGGADNEAIGNSFTITPVSGGGLSAFQLNPFGGTANSGFLVQGNTFDSTGFYIIGLNTTLITGNTLTNPTLGNTIGISVVPALGTPINGVIIDNNIIDATVSDPNSAYLGMIPQDPGQVGDVRNLTMSNNKVTATAVVMALQDFEDSCLATCNPLPTTLDSKILNNTLTSIWTGSILSIRGGTYGMVNGVIVEGNVLIGPPGYTNQILQDANTFNATILGNTLSPSKRP